MSSRFDEMFIRGIFKYNVPVSKGLAEAVSNVTEGKSKYGRHYLNTRGNESGSIRGALAGAENKPGDEVVWDAIFGRKKKAFSDDPADTEKDKKKKPAQVAPVRPQTIKPPAARGPIRAPVARASIKPPSARRAIQPPVRTP